MTAIIRASTKISVEPDADEERPHCGQEGPVVGSAPQEQAAASLIVRMVSFWLWSSATASRMRLAWIRPFSSLPWELRASNRK